MDESKYNRPHPMIKNVVIVHGFADVTGMWRRLVNPLSAAGFDPRLFEYPTFRNAVDIPGISETLRVFIDRNFHDEDFQIVGHSQGGLIAEWTDFFLQPPGLKRIVTVATPFHGNSLPLFVPRSVVEHWPFSRKQLKGLMCWSPVIRSLAQARWNRPTATDYFSFIGFNGRIWKVESDGVVAVCEARRDAAMYDILGSSVRPLTVSAATNGVILKRNHLPVSWLRSKNALPQMLIEVLHGRTLPQPPMPPIRQFALIVPSRIEDEWQWPSNARRLVSRATFDPQYRVVYGETRESRVRFQWMDWEFEARPGETTYVVSEGDLA
jgi:pimeloyl-ACP methyl ester carboxylesterase